MKKYDIVLVSVNSPVMLGVYDNCKLVFFIIIDGKTSDILPFVFANIFTDSVESSKVKIIECGIYKDFSSKNSNILESSFLDSKSSDFIESNFTMLAQFSDFKDIYYARGVGSLSSIKLTHIFLQTLHLTRDIKLHATNSFYFSPNNEIKAFGAMSFFLKDSIESNLDSNLEKQIFIAKSSQHIESLKLPLSLQKNAFNEPCSPLYITPAL
ncbi:hypothetical protein DCO58_07130 [Helicobacter saguini]|uniref:Uncharacterized protein n=1 Tax=Helicobacter saguini TaxID=1548018 RepID=A0A347VGH0_9HELI|nr:hypothetical protein [Helicobacter saguini]MWV61894.1 hypothetical protein [Helicobacter saguini]MWV67431.1 hypothetical protein [Helicobacter saguini]MWV69784.1 hypothetical protein [Helicobacter saguini]MWV72999.1 hypothetical protein [Helicobacter saguini]TLD95621.1 hypothetical protein LS64_001850 [Helicobacter saguini]